MAYLPPFFPAIPFDTAKAAWVTFGRNNFYLATGEQANSLFGGIRLADPEGQFRKPAHTLAILYMVTIFQYAESLPDQQAMEALGERIEWKYALHLPLDYPGLAVEALCEFRQWLASDQVAQHSLQLLLERLAEIPGCPAQIRVKPEAMEVLTEVCHTSRLALIWESLNRAIRTLASKDLDWMPGARLPHWFARYTNNTQRYLHLEGSRLERHALIHKAGTDIIYLLKAVEKSGAAGLEKLPAIVKLKQLWMEQYEEINGRVFWRKEVYPGCLIYSLMSRTTMDSEYGLVD